jgi:hypothetical protein
LHSGTRRNTKHRNDFAQSTVSGHSPNDSGYCVQFSKYLRRKIAIFSTISPKTASAFC